MAVSRIRPRTPTPPLLFLLWAGLLLWPALLHPGWVLMQPGAEFSDLLISHWPDAEFLRRALFEFHQFPLWNPSILSGAPFAADPLAGLWYPLNWLTVILPLPFAFNLLLVLHLAWAGWGMFCWARADGFALWPSLVGGLAYAAMPKIIAHIAAGHMSLVYAVAWMPWLLMNAERGMRNDHAGSSFMGRHALLTALILALIFLADVRWAVYAGGVMAVWWLARTRSWPAAGRLFLCVALFLFLAAVLWLPLVEFVRYSARSVLTPEEAGVFSLPPGYLIGLLIPNLGGFQEYMTYVGLATLALAVVGATRDRDRAGILTVLGLGLVSIWWALGPGAGLFLLLNRIPGLSLLRVPSRAWFIVGLGVSWLAVRGAAAVEEGWRPAGRTYNLASAGLAAALWVLAMGGSLITKRPLANLLIPAVAVTGVLIGLRVPPALGVLAVVAAVELLAVDSTLIAAQPVSRGPAAEWLSQQPGRWRVYSPSYSLPQLDAARHGLEQADGVNPLQLAETVNYMDAATGVEREGYSVTLPPFKGDVATSNAGASPDPDQLGQLNVRYILSEFDIRAEGLELKTRLGNTRIYENTQDAGRVCGGDLLSWSPNRIVVSATGPGQVMLAEVWYPGWVATIDGAPADIGRTEIFRSVTVGAGRHEIVFEFRPTTVYMGGALSILGCMMLAYALRRRS